MVPHKGRQTAPDNVLSSLDVTQGYGWDDTKVQYFAPFQGRQLRSRGLPP